MSNVKIKTGRKEGEEKLQSQVEHSTVPLPLGIVDAPGPLVISQAQSIREHIEILEHPFMETLRSMRKATKKYISKYSRHMSALLSCVDTEQKVNTVVAVSQES